MKNSKKCLRKWVFKRVLMFLPLQPLLRQKLKLRLTRRSVWPILRKKRRRKLRRLKRRRRSNPLLNRSLTRLREKRPSPKLLRRDKRRQQVPASRVPIFQLRSKSRKVVRNLKIKRTLATIDECMLCSYYIV